MIPVWQTLGLTAEGLSWRTPEGWLILIKTNTGMTGDRTFNLPDSDTQLGGGTGLSLSTVEMDLGSVPVLSGTFDITGLSGLTPGRPVLIQQAVGPYTGKGTLADECEDLVRITGYVVDSTTIRAHWNSHPFFVKGNVKFNYTQA